MYVCILAECEDRSQQQLRVYRPERTNNLLPCYSWSPGLLLMVATMGFPAILLKPRGMRVFIAQCDRLCGNRQGSENGVRK